MHEWLITCVHVWEKVKNLRVYSLNGNSVEESKAWVAAVKENVNRCKASNDPDKVGTGAKETVDLSYHPYYHTTPYMTITY
jgi:hypothetical protein